MKVLHLDIEGGQGGSSRSLRYLLQGLGRFDVQSEVWHGKYGPSYDFNLKRNLECKVNKNIISVIPLKKNNLKNLIYVSYKLSRLFLLAFQIKRKNIDILHLNYEGLLLLALILRLFRFKKKIIVHVRTPIPSNLFSFFFCKLFNFVDGIIFISKVERSLLKKVNQKINKRFIINNNPSPKELIDRKIRIKKNIRFRAIFLGNIDFTKAPDRIIELAEYIKKINLPIKFYIYGKEKKSLFSKKNIINEEFINKSIKDKKLEGFVFFKGHTSNPENIITKSDILIRSSRNGDCWGRDVIEGMSAGLLVIATGTRKVFISHKKNGLLYQSWDIKKIASDLKEIINNRELFFTIQKNAQSYAISHFSIEKHSNDIYNFFKSF